MTIPRPPAQQGREIQRYDGSQRERLRREVAEATGRFDRSPSDVRDRTWQQRYRQPVERPERGHNNGVWSNSPTYRTPSVPSRMPRNYGNYGDGPRSSAPRYTTQPRAESPRYSAPAPRYSAPAPRASAPAPRYSAPAPSSNTSRGGGNFSRGGEGRMSSGRIQHRQ